jgi:hypothetical protein
VEDILMAKMGPVKNEELKSILSPDLFALWTSTIAKIDAAYDMEKEWDKGGKAAKYVLRFRRGGKTLVSLFPKESAIGLMVVYGKDERAKFEAQQADFSSKVVSEYHDAKTYHDGKWIMFHLPDEDVSGDLIAILAIKRKPKKVQP